jgi:protein transport protein SEC31
MVRLREIPRTAAFAWSPGSAPPLLATGTRAGAVDDDFSNDTNLELWDLQLDQLDASTDLSPVGTISTDSRCVPHNWTRCSSDTDTDSTTLHGASRPPTVLVVSLPVP